MTIREPGTAVGQIAIAVVDQEAEGTYRSENYVKRGYVERDRPHGDYEPAYQHGWESRARL